jgi:hypothetical protein
VIIFHAGMPKAGSTSLQEWFVEHERLLRERDVHCMRIVPSASGSIALEPATQTDAASRFLAADPATRPAVAAQICAALAAYAESAETVVVSKESYEVFFNAPGREEVLGHLEALARAHPLRVTYYVRPQDRWLESAWLQWGFRVPAPPDEWVRGQRQRIDYFDTFRAVREHAPHLTFDVRPVRPDLLDGGDVVTDFVHGVLGFTDLPADVTRREHSNQSLPLELVLLLRNAPPGMFWSSGRDNRRLYHLKELILPGGVPESDILGRSRAVLQHYAAATFEPGNRQLITELGWATDHFVTQDAQGVVANGDGLAELNEIWKSSASDAERTLILRALQQLLDDAAPTNAAIDTPLAARDDARPAITRRTLATRVRAAIGRRRHGSRGGLTVAPPRRVAQGQLVRLRFRNNGPTSAFDAVAVIEGDEQPRRLGWQGTRRTVRVARGETQLLRLAIARPNQAPPAFDLLTLDESGVEAGEPCGDTVDVTIVVRECESGRICVAHDAQLRFRVRAGGAKASSVELVTATKSRRAVAAALPAAPAPAPGAEPEPPKPRPRHNDHPRVVDIAADVGLDLETRTYGAVVFDANNDGWPDILLGRHSAPAFLYRNNRGTFVRDDAVQFPDKTDRHCAAAGDFTGNGRLDLFCVTGGASGHEAKGAPNELWLQQPDGTFVNEGAQDGLADPYGRGREALLFDATGDGRLDVLVGNVSPRSDGLPSPNRLFVNQGNGRFSPAPELGLDLEYSVGGAGRVGSAHGGGNWPMGRLRAFDADGNGWTDVLMCAQRDDDSAQRLHFFRNGEGRGFREVTADVGLAGIEALDVAVADLTGDGAPDLVVVNSASLFVYVNDGGTFRRDYEMPVDHAFRVAIGDADGDGCPDIYVMRTNGVPGPDLADLLLLRRGTHREYETITLPIVEGVVRDDDVYAIDYDRDGRDEFLVLHGHSRHPAPLQLIKLR